MKVSYNWLQEFFDEKLPEPQELGELLTFHAFELEEVIEKGDDYIIHVDILPNRSSDALSHRGIAREIATLLDTKIKDPYIELPKDFADQALKTSDTVTLAINPDSKCRRAMKRLVTNVTVKESPSWLVEKLAVFDQKSINNVVDITNYITLYLGQPVHAFDYDKIAPSNSSGQAGEKKEIIIRVAKDREELEILDGKKVTLDPSIAVIADSEKALDIAGVKGGANSGIDENTKNILLSVSNFDPVSVRRASKKLKIQTDASNRFQNNPSAELNPIAMEHLAYLVHELAGGSVSEDVLDEYPIKRENPKVTVNTVQINNLLGTDLKDGEVTKIFDRLGFVYEGGEGAYEVIAPFERTDITIAEDVIEEVGRVNGYEKLEAKRLVDLGGRPEIHKEFYYSDSVRNILNSLGFSEIYGYTFRNSGDFEAIEALASDKAFLRTNLSDGMEEYLEMNTHNAPLFGLDRIKLFEIGTIFPKSGEHKSLCIAVSGKKTEKVLTEVVEKLEQELGATCDAKISGNILEIDFTSWLEKFPEGKSYDSYEKNLTQYKEFSQYPFVLRDLAVWVPDSISEEELTNLIKENVRSTSSGQAEDLLLRIDQFDRFEKEGRVSYAFHMVFQSMDRTLSDEEINAHMDTVTNALNSQEGFEVR